MLSSYGINSPRSCNSDPEKNRSNLNGLKLDPAKPNR